MPFDDSVISAVTARRAGQDLVVAWSSSAPPGTLYQVYVDGEPVWHGTARRAVVPMPPHPRGPVHVGAVGASEAAADFGASLAAPPRRARLSWSGGRYLGADLRGFRVYQGPAPGAAPDLSRPAGDVPAFPSGVLTDGYGSGGYGSGRYGHARGSYRWTSGFLGPGAWHFAVVSYDSAGNESAPWSPTVTLAGPPGPPAVLNPSGARVAGAYDPATGSLGLSWSPPAP